MQESKPFRSADLLFALVLIALGLGVIAESVRTSLPMLEKGDATMLDMPGLTPIVCAGLLIAFSLAVAADALRRGGRLGWFASAEFRSGLRSREALALYTVFGSLAVYVFGLFPFLPYLASTSLFLAGFMALCGELHWKSLLISAATALFITLVFGELFAVMLPGWVFGG